MPNPSKRKWKTRLLCVIDNYLLKYREDPTVYFNFNETLLNNGDYFFADINKFVDPYGNSYGNGWQYFVSIVKQIGKYSENEIVSDFERYIKITYHETAYDGFTPEPKNSSGLKKFPAPCLAFLTPWSTSNTEVLVDRINDIIKDERLISFSDKDTGNPLDRPEYLARNHYNRLFQLRNSIIKNGYNFNHNPGDPVQGFVLTRQKDYRILVFSGQHRVAVLAGLNHQRMPVKFANKYIINEGDVDNWPLVKNGMWNREDSLLYFHHLFDFDSRSWAVDKGLLI